MIVYRSNISGSDGVYVVWAESRERALVEGAARAEEVEGELLSTSRVVIPAKTRASLVAWLKRNLATDNG